MTKVITIATGKLGWSNLGKAEAEQLQAMMQHSADCSANLIVMIPG